MSSYTLEQIHNVMNNPTVLYCIKKLKEHEEKRDNLIEIIKRIRSTAKSYQEEINELDTKIIKIKSELDRDVDDIVLNL